MSSIGIEGVYHVYMKWSPETNPVYNSTLGRTHLTFRNRQTADEFFRFCLTATAANGTDIAFASLHREGPQFWYFIDSPKAGPTWELPRYILQWNPTTWGKRVILTLMQDWNGRSQNVFDVGATTEWLSGSAFFIKSTNVQAEFWYSSGGLIKISTSDRTKFVVRAVDFKGTETPVLIRSDKVTIELASAASGPNHVYVGAANEGGKLTLGGEATVWTFGDFFTGLGIERFAAQSGSGTERVVIRSAATAVVWDLV